MHNIKTPPPNPANAAPQRAAAEVTPNPDELLTPEQAALVLGLSVKTLATWRSSGRWSLPYLRCGGRIRYRRDDLTNWLQARRSTSTSTSTSTSPANAVKAAA